MVLSLPVLLLCFSCKWSTCIPLVLLSSSPDCWFFGMVAGVQPSTFPLILSPSKAVLQAVSLSFPWCASFLSGHNCQGQVPLFPFLGLMGICLFASLSLMGTCPGCNLSALSPVS